MNSASHADSAAGAKTDAAELRELIARHPRLFRMMVTFNYRPADYLHPALRTQFVQPGIHASLWREARARRALSALILQQIGLEHRPCFDRLQTAWPLVLLDRKRLKRLANHVGAVLLAPHARRAMSREEVLAWKERLTAPAYHFVMTSASLLPHVKSEAQIDESVSPEALGFGWIAASLEAAPDELSLRARLKFPPVQITQNVTRNRAAQVVHAVFSTLEPKWISSFAATRQ